MKKLFLLILIQGLSYNVSAQINYSTNLTTGLGMTYKSNFLGKYGADFNFEFNNGLLLGFGAHFGRNSIGPDSRTPDVVEKNRTLQVHLGYVQHTSEKVSIQTYIGVARIKTVAVSSQENGLFYAEWLLENALGNGEEEYESRYLTKTFKDLGIPVGVNFIFRENKVGWHFGYYAVIAKHHELGFKLGVTLGSGK